MTSTIRGRGSPEVDTYIKILVKLGKQVDGGEEGGVSKSPQNRLSFVNGPTCSWIIFAKFNFTLLLFISNLVTKV